MLPSQEGSLQPFWDCIDIQVGSERYPYWYGHDCLDAIVGSLAAMEADRFVIVSDDTVLALHADKLIPQLSAVAPTHVLAGAPGEALKSTRLLVEHAERAVALGATRRTLVVAFGGGVVGNLAGLLAALLFRGVRLVHVPTTLVAAADSVISLKQAINSSRGKNHFGVYYRPAAVMTDVQLLTTLPVREWRSGLCEAIKNGLAIRPEGLPRLRQMVVSDLERGDPHDLVWLLEESIAAKLHVMADDAQERKQGIVLEYGHTVGHAIETCDREDRTAGLSHGEAIGIGMVAAARLSWRRGWLADEDMALHVSMLSALGAPTRIPEHLTTDQILDAIRHDNKRGCIPAEAEEVPMVLLRGLGEAARTGSVPLIAVNEVEIREVLDTMRQTR